MRNQGLRRRPSRDQDHHSLFLSILNTSNTYQRASDRQCDKRSKAEKELIYKRFKHNIPRAWRIEDLDMQSVIGSNCLLNYLENYGPLSALIFKRTQSLIKQLDDKFDDGGDFSELMYLSMSNDIMDFMKFIQRILSFYQYNFDQATNHNNRSAKRRLDYLITHIIPSSRELHQVLKHKRKHSGRDRMSHDFPSDDENIIYIVVLKILESYHLEFGNLSSSSKRSTYEKHFLPLAIELYENHVNSSDLILLNSLLRCGSQPSPCLSSKLQNSSLHSYFSNLDDLYSQRFVATSQVLLEKDDYLSHF